MDDMSNISKEELIVRHSKLKASYEILSQKYENLEKTFDKTKKAAEKTFRLTEKFEPKTVEELGYLESCVRNRFTEDEIEELKKACKCYDEMYDLYLHNSKFKTYVDRVCKSYQFRVEFALLNVTVQEVGRQYASSSTDVITRESFVCACEQEDKSC